MMSVSVAEIVKNRCRTMVAEPMEANACGTALYRDHVVCLSRDQAAQSRPTQVACLNRWYYYSRTVPSECSAGSVWESPSSASKRFLGHRGTPRESPHRREPR